MSKSSGKQRLKSLIESKAYSFNKDLEEVDDWDRNSRAGSPKVNTIKIETNPDPDSTFKKTQATQPE